MPRVQATEHPAAYSGHSTKKFFVEKETSTINEVSHGHIFSVFFHLDKLSDSCAGL